ncbi:MAG: SEC-C metal-binding domain-containing protein [Solirubrobacteraceae bacterium]
MQTRSLDPRALLDAPPQDEFALLDCGWTGLRSSRSTPSARLAVRASPCGSGRKYKRCRGA